MRLWIEFFRMHNRLQVGEEAVGSPYRREFRGQDNEYVLRNTGHRVQDLLAVESGQVDNHVGIGLSSHLEQCIDSLTRQLLSGPEISCPREHGQPLFGRDIALEKNGIEPVGVGQHIRHRELVSKIQIGSRIPYRPAQVNHHNSAAQQFCHRRGQIDRHRGCPDSPFPRRYPVDPTDWFDFFVAELVGLEPLNRLAQRLFRDRFGQEFPSPRPDRLNDHHGIFGFGEREQPGVRNPEAQHCQGIGRLDESLGFENDDVRIGPNEPVKGSRIRFRGIFRGLGDNLNTWLFGKSLLQRLKSFCACNKSDTYFQICHSSFILS